MNAKHEALAVGFANDRTCALHVEMCDAVNQHNSMKHAMSLSIRRLETELDDADTKRGEIMKEFRSDLRSEHDKFIECEHHLDLEESQFRLQLARSEGLHSQLVRSEELSSSEASGMRDIRITGLRFRIAYETEPSRSNARATN